jgi:hypothetical protein
MGVPKGYGVWLSVVSLSYKLYVIPSFKGAIAAVLYENRHFLSSPEKAQGSAGYATQP